MLRWKGADGDWRDQSGRLAIRRGAASVVIAIQNQGPVAAGLVLLEEGLRQLPPWILREQLEERAVEVPPGGQATLEIPLVSHQLEALFRATAHQEGSDEPRPEATLQLLTTLCHRSEAGWSARSLDIVLQVAREPWIRPGGSTYRFLPLELLAAGGLAHTLELSNEHAEPIEIIDIDVVDAPDIASPPVAIDARSVRLEAASFARLRRDGVPRVLPPGTRCPAELLLRATTLPEATVGWFSLLVRCRYRHHAAGRMHAIVEGVVGRAPGLELDRTRIEHPSLDQGASFRLRLRNPGDLPVRVTTLELLRADGSPPPEGQPDWFELHGVEPGDVLGPGQERTLHYELRPDKRPFDELDQEWCTRKVVLGHDGFGTPEQRRLGFEVGAQLGKVRVATGIHLGIDFGTSSSMVCVVRADGQVQIALELDSGGQAREQLPSLMFYQGAPPDEPDTDPFLYGQEADDSAGIEPSNLVRSIKSVIAQHPDTRYHFLEEPQPGQFRRRSYRPQELLDLFITELRRRAERAVSNLDVRQLRSLQLDSGKVRFVRAVFSHPVEVGTEMKQALMHAAHAAGLNKAEGSAEAFEAGACVDEATAAALSYVYARMSGDVATERPPLDLERVMCFDMGGGTTDVAAVEIADMSRFLAGACDSITVTLEVTAGDPLFGGDDLDELVAGWVLEAIHRQSAKQGAPIDKHEIERAVGFRSFAEYYNGFEVRRAQRQRRDDRSLQEQARANYHKAMEVLRKAEEAKCALSYTDRFELNFSGEGWPRRGRPHEVDNFVVVVKRDRFEASARELALEQAALVDRVRRNAGWSWDEITTMLFTGQGTRVPAIRGEILGRLQAHRSAEAPPLIVVQPDDGSGFDPKRCVAMGAAIWGTRQDARWIAVRNRLVEELTFDLQRPWGPFRFETVPGLERGTALPTEATITFRGPRGSLELYKDRKLHVAFTFPPAAEVLVRVEGPGQYLLRSGETWVRGEPVQ